MTHAQLVSKAVEWLRRYGCGIILSEQACVSGEVPDAIGWKGACRSVVVECKLSRADFLADRAKPFRQNPETALGCERWYLTPAGLLSDDDLPRYWGLLEARAGKLQVAVKASRHNRRTPTGVLYEMNLLLASLRRVEVRIEPQTITEFLKWKNRIAEYNGGSYPAGLLPAEQEDNLHLSTSLRPVSRTDRLKPLMGLSSEHRNLSGDSKRVSLLGDGATPLGAGVGPSCFPSGRVTLCPRSFGRGNFHCRRS